MSPRNSDDAPVGPVRKPEVDLYTVMLIVSLLALIVGTVFLFLESSAYGPTPAGKPNVSTGMLSNVGAARLASAAQWTSPVSCKGGAWCVSG
jgi:hypothetical protein